MHIGNGLGQLEIVVERNATDTRLGDPATKGGALTDLSLMVELQGGDWQQTILEAERPQGRDVSPDARAHVAGLNRAQRGDGDPRLRGHVGQAETPSLPGEGDVATNGRGYVNHPAGGSVCASD